ncbi:MAG: molecular chaperone TorD family protein [Eggerthellaceae bacterium]|nr:molecular chaperone TorD family protein [Eggerthellaceae bacterium]
MTNTAPKLPQVSQALRGFAAFADMTAALLFRPISETQIQGLADLDWAAIGEINDEMGLAANDISRYLAKRSKGSRQELAIDYTQSLGGLASYEGRYAVPCASVYTSEDGLLYQETYHEVYTLFREFGVTRSEGFDYPDDHLSLLFSFLGIMATRGAEALEQGDGKTARHYLGVCPDVAQKYILSWYEDFAELAQKLITTRFYRGVIHLARGLAQYSEELFADCLAELDALES